MQPQTLHTPKYAPDPPHSTDPAWRSFLDEPSEGVGQYAEIVGRDESQGWLDATKSEQPNHIIEGNKQ